MSNVNSANELAKARLLDFMSSRNRWYRSLWNPGLILSLKEVLESIKAGQSGILGSGLISSAIEVVLRNINYDHGIQSSNSKNTLRQALITLQKSPRYNGLDYIVVENLVSTIESEYLENWANYLDRCTDSYSHEHASRSLASHLLDSGFSRDYMHRWLTFRFKYENAKRELSDIIREAHALISEGLKTFEIFFAFAQSPLKKLGRADNWIDARSASKWLEDNNFKTSGLRQYGGIILKIEGRDSRAAADRALEIIENLSARARLVSIDEVRYIQKIWVSGQKEPYDIHPNTRGLELGTLIREEEVFSRPSSDASLDAAFEMLSSLQTSSPSAAISSGWAAIEALLSEPNDRGGAADRLAAIIACSYPRAELTILASHIEKNKSDLSNELRQVESNRDRSAIVAQAILDNKPIGVIEPTDNAAVLRIQKLFKSPAESLKEINQYVSTALHRMYRQRNLVLHGGYTDAVALRSCLRTVAPLVGAGMDRIAHAYYVKNIPPLHTAAYARISLNTVSDRKSIDCLDLLP